jgi:GntR family transcriptional regulator / MocR family aminotransferase
MLRPWDLQIIIDTNCDRAVYVQIADAIINAIKVGKLRGGDALPGSRQLAAKLNVNRNTIVESLDVLIAQGWLVSKERKGIFVSEKLPTSAGGKNVQFKAVAMDLPKKPEIVFDDGLPDSRLAPIKELAAAYRQIFNQKGRWDLMGYSGGAGEEGFRNAIAQMLNFKRGMRLTKDDIFITRGSQMAMYLSAHSLVGKGDYVAVENPGYKPAWEAFEHARAKILPISVDKEGLNVEELKKQLRSKDNIKAVYITPHHQFPTTVTLGFQRRLELVSLANLHGLTIIEDDYDNEFHFGQRPILPVSSLESLERYVYIGTMSKIVAPALRIGYLASSKSILEKISNLRRIIDVQNDNIMAQAMLQLINDGHIKRHLRKATLAYKAKRDLFEDALKKHLAGKIIFDKPEGGLAFWIEPTKKSDLVSVQRRLLQKGIQMLSPQDYSFQNPVNGLRMGYASLSQEQMDKGLKTLAKLI